MSDWLVAQKVSTPDILGDIKKYCGVLLTAKEFDALEITNRRKLILITERLELVEHLLVIHNAISTNTKIKRRVFKPVNDNSESVEIESQLSCVLWGHDFAGANFDIEAIVFYLLLTCVDTIKGQPEFVSAFDWLCNPSNMSLLVNQDQQSLQKQLEDLQKKYGTDFGITRKFIEAFVDNLSDDLQQEIVESLAVVKVRDSKISQESMVAWNRRDVKGKLKKLGDRLYTIRSSFTHTSLRTFLPTQPLETVSKITGEQLLCKPNVNLLDLLIRVIQCLIKTQLIGATRQNNAI